MISIVNIYLIFMTMLKLSGPIDKLRFEMVKNPTAFEEALQLNTQDLT